MTLEESFFGIKPNLSAHKVFGCVAFVHLDKFQRNKFNSRFNLGIYLGLDNESKAYCIYIPFLKKVQIIRDVIFGEFFFLTIPLADSTFSLASLFSLTRYLVNISNDDDFDSDNFTPSLEGLPGSSSILPFLNLDPAITPSLTSFRTHLWVPPSCTQLISASHSVPNYSSTLNIDNNPYFIDTTIPDILPKTSFVPYYPFMTDINEWPTTDSQSILSPILPKDTLVNPSLALGS